MVNKRLRDGSGAVGMTEPNDPERALALPYAAADRRAGLTALLALDDTLGQILRTTREPMVGQMRLTWWYEALCALDNAPPPAQPVLQALATEVVARGVSGSALAGLVDGWEILLDPDPLDPDMLDSYAAQRGGRLFALAGQVLGAASADPLTDAGAGWALADLARHSRNSQAAKAPAAHAKIALHAAMQRRWSRAVRSLGALALIAQMDLAVAHGTSRSVTSPRRIARLGWHRLTGG